MDFTVPHFAIHIVWRANVICTNRKSGIARKTTVAYPELRLGVLDKFIHEGHEALSSFAKTDRVNFNEKESASIYYGIMASAVKHNIGLDSKASIESAAKRFLFGMSWKGFTDFKQECVTSWTKLFATNEVQFTDKAIDNFLAFVDTCHIAQTLTFRLVAQMTVPTNLRIGMEHKKWDWEENQQREKRIGNHDKSHIDEKEIIA